MKYIKWTNMDRNRQKRTETDRNGHKWTETDKNRKKGTETISNKQKRTKANRNGEKWIETDRNRLTRRKEADLKKMYWEGTNNHKDNDDTLTSRIIDRCPKYELICPIY